jgi:hypothetical protein
MTRHIFALLLVLTVPIAAAAQTAQGEPDVSQVRMQFGPLYLNPLLSVTNLGVDNNVFNDPEDAEPKSDFTFTVTPAADFWLRAGRSWLSGAVREDLVYYQTYSNQRSANTAYKLAWLAPFNHLVFNPSVGYLRTRDRPGFEIDERALRTEREYGVPVEFRLFSRTFLGVRGNWRDVRYDENQEFDGTDLQTELNRTITTYALTVRHELTPLTSLTFDVAREQDRFEFSSQRDADSSLFAGGVKFDPVALIKGFATVGYRDFKPLSPDVPPFTGMTASVDLSYVARESTRLSVQSVRDVQYSYDVDQPYYLQSGVTATIDQRVFGPLDVTGRVGAQRLDYRDRVGPDVAVSDRTDRVRSYGAGMGYRFGRTARVGFLIEQQHRDSGVASRRYEGMKFGASVTYGF